MYVDFWVLLPFEMCECVSLFSGEGQVVGWNIEVWWV
jgi:hypothetical protein